MFATDSVFKSVTKFVDAIKEEYDSVKTAILYFENDDAFKNQFDKICIKPVFIQLKKKTKSITLTNQKINDLFKGQLIVSFGEASFKRLPSEDHLICELLINFDPKVYKEQIYYETNLLICSNKKNIEMIRKQEIQPVIGKDEEDMSLINISEPTRRS